MAASSLPLAAVAALLLSLYVSLAVVACKYWRYLIQKNATRDPAEPRWTLALVDQDTVGAAVHKLHIDEHAFQPRRPDGAFFAQSVRSQIEGLLSSGAYLGSFDARRRSVRAQYMHIGTLQWRCTELGLSDATALRIKTLPLPVSNFTIVKSRFGYLQLADAESPWRLAPLRMCAAAALAGEPSAPAEPHNTSDDADDLSLELDALRPQIAQIVQAILSGVSAPVLAVRRVQSLSLTVVELPPGESTAPHSSTGGGGMAPKILR
jgi:hypothetical protein